MKSAFSPFMQHRAPLRTTASLLARAALGTALLAGMAAPVAAQGFPNKPIRMVLPFPAGSATEITFRPVAESMTKILGQPVLLDSRPGGGSMVGSLFVKAQPPDGYTMVMASNTLTVRSLVKNAQVDVRKDYTPISLTSIAPLVIAVNTEQVKATTFKELMEEARAKPGQLNYGSYGIGSGANMFMELMLNENKVKMVHVPFQGTAQASLETAAGRIQVNPTLYPTLTAHVASLGGSGKLRMIAISMAERSRLIPGVPGMKESGYPDMDYGLWGGMVGPAGMPRPIVDMLNSAINEALRDPKVAENFNRIGTNPLGGTPEDMARRIQIEYDAYAKLIRETGISLE